MNPRHYLLLLVISYLGNTSLCYASSPGTSIESMRDIATKSGDAFAQYYVAMKYLKGEVVAKDPKEAFQWLTLAADQNHVKAQYELAKLYLDDAVVTKNIPEAIRLFTYAAKKNIVDAQFNLGKLYLHTKGHTNLAQARQWLEKAANHEHGSAQFELANMYIDARGVNRDLTRGKALLVAAVENGHPRAKKELEQLLQKTGGANPFSKNKTQIASAKKKSVATSKQTTASNSKPATVQSPELSQKERLLKGANAGNVDAQYFLGAELLKGSTLFKKDPIKASEWLRQAAEQGHAGAQHKLGIIYRGGMGLPKSESEAIKWFRLAAGWGVLEAQRDLDQLLKKQLLQPQTNLAKRAEKGEPNAQYQLGMRYVNGEGIGKDPQKAATWLKKAAEQNNPQAQYQLGKMYKEGIGVTPDPKQAKHWLFKAADGGVTNANHLLRAYFQTETLQPPPRPSKDKGMGAAELPQRLAAESGDTEAQYQLGIMYLNGEQVRKDPFEAIKWLSLAATSKHMMASLTLGDVYYKGDGLEKDYSEAAKWYQIAAARGDQKAQYMLGNMYKNGLGVGQNTSKAVKWLRKAAAQGHKKAQREIGGCVFC